MAYGGLEFAGLRFESGVVAATATWSCGGLERLGHWLSAARGRAARITLVGTSQGPLLGNRVFKPVSVLAEETMSLRPRTCMFINVNVYSAYGKA